MTRERGSGMVMRTVRVRHLGLSLRMDLRMQMASVIEMSLLKGSSSRRGTSLRKDFVTLRNSRTVTTRQRETMTRKTTRLYWKMGSGTPTERVSGTAKRWAKVSVKLKQRGTARQMRKLMGSEKLREKDWRKVSLVQTLPHRYLM